jgi:hypothetical protein
VSVEAGQLELRRSVRNARWQGRTNPDAITSRKVDIKLGEKRFKEAGVAKRSARTVSTFDDLLKGEGILEEVQAKAN